MPDATAKETANEIDMTANKKRPDVSRRRLLTGVGRHDGPPSQLTDKVE